MNTHTARITVVVDAAHRPAIDALTHRLRAEGMQVEQVLRRLGTVTGTIPEGRLPALERIEGVASVERERRYRLPPPEEPVQ
jgi:hypothetical protein